MKVQIATIAEMVSEFSGFHHLHPSLSTSSLTSRKYSTASESSEASESSQSSRHSLNITVGVEEVPTFPPPPPVHFIKHSSSPAVSRVASVTSLQGKVKKIRRTASLESDSDFSAHRKVSTTSYRVMH